MKLQMPKGSLGKCVVRMYKSNPTDPSYNSYNNHQTYWSPCLQIINRLKFRLAKIR